MITVLQGAPSLLYDPPSLLHDPPSLLHDPPSLLHDPPSLLHDPPSLLYSAALLVPRGLAQYLPAPPQVLLVLHPLQHRVLVLQESRELRHVQARPEVRHPALHGGVTGGQG